MGLSGHRGKKRRFGEFPEAREGLSVLLFAARGHRGAKMGGSSSKNDFSNKIGTGSLGAQADQELEIDADMAMLDLRLKKLTSVRDANARVRCARMPIRCHSYPLLASPLVAATLLDRMPLDLFFNALASN